MKLNVKAPQIHALNWALLLSAGMTLSACGQRGPLYLPPPASPPGIQNPSLPISAGPGPWAAQGLAATTSSAPISNGSN